MAFDPSQYGATDLGVIGGPDSGGYSGDSLEDFYDFLMTPRRQQRWSGSGGIRHYGPDRDPSINPEDAAMAEIIMQQMETERANTAAEEVRQSELARRRAQDEILMPSGKGGGSISFEGGEPMEGGGFAGPRGTKWGFPGAELEVGGGMPEAPPERQEDLSNTEWALFGSDTVPGERARAEGYNSRGPTMGQRVGASAKVMRAESKLIQAASADERFAGMSGDQILEEVKRDPTGTELMTAALGEYAAALYEDSQFNPRTEERWPGPGGG